MKNNLLQYPFQVWVLPFLAWVLPFSAIFSVGSTHSTRALSKHFRAIGAFDCPKMFVFLVGTVGTTAKTDLVPLVPTVPIPILYRGTAIGLLLGVIVSASACRRPRARRAITVPTLKVKS